MTVVQAAVGCFREGAAKAGGREDPRDRGVRGSLGQGERDDERARARLPVKETAATLGAFYEEKRGFLQATGFVVKPDRTIAVSQFSSGPIGRLVWQDVLGLVQFYKKQAK